MCIPAGQAATLTTASTVRGINAGGTLTVNVATLTIADVPNTSPSSVSGGTLAGTGTVALSSGTLAVVGGQMNDAGTTTVASGATMTVTGDSAGLVMSSGRTLVNNGTLTITGTNTGSTGYLLLNGAGNTITNNNLLQLRDGGDISGSGLLRVPASGIVRSTNAGSHDIQVPIELAGLIEPTGGSLTLNATLTPAASGSTTGVLSTNGGTLSLPNIIDIPAASRISTQSTGVTLTGTAQGDGELRITAGTLAVVGASMNDPGTTTVVAGATMTVTGDSAGLVMSSGRTLVNNGTLTITGTNTGSTGYLLLNGAGNTITNNALLEFAADGDISGSGTVTNTVTGAITKPAGSGTGISSISSTVENDGTTTASNGTLAVVGSGTPPSSAGTFTTTGTSATTLVGGVVLGNGALLTGPGSGSGSVTIDGTVTIPAGATATASGRTGLAGGTVDGDGQLAVASGTLAVVGGQMNDAGTTTVASGATMTVTGDSAGLVMSSGRTLVNNGTLTITGTNTGSTGYLLLNGAGNTITNNNLLQLRDGGDISGSGLLRVPASGIVRSTNAGSHDIQVPIELAGLIEPTGGSLTLNATLTPAASGSTTGVLSTNGGTLSLPNIIDIPAASRISTQSTGVTLTGTAEGDGELRITAGTLAVVGASMNDPGTTTVVAGATMTVTGDSAGLVMSSGRTLVNNGTLTITGTNTGSTGYLLLNGAGNTITNNALLRRPVGADISGSGDVDNTATGTITKPSGSSSNTSTVSVTTDNDGTIEVAQGMLEFHRRLPGPVGDHADEGHVPHDLAGHPPTAEQRGIEPGDDHPRRRQRAVGERRWEQRAGGPHGQQRLAHRSRAAACCRSARWRTAAW